MRRATYAIAGLAGLAPRIARAVSVPLIDGLEAAVVMAQAAVRRREHRADRAGPIAAIGLSPELAALLAAPPVTDRS